MSHYGTMHSYDNAMAIGWLTPDDGSERIAFARAEQFWVHHTPLIGRRYRYDIRTHPDGKTTRAANLQLIELSRMAVVRSH